jgi:hypothetical protein
MQLITMISAVALMSVATVAVPEDMERKSAVCISSSPLASLS